MKRYPSKIGYGLLSFVLILIVAPSVMVSSVGNWVGFGILLLTLLFALYVFLSIYYVVDGNILVIRVGFLINKKIKISTIQSIAESNSWIGSPAASLDRLNVVYNKHNSILISPRDKSGFINHLIQINPQIAVNYKSKTKLKT